MRRGGLPGLAVIVFATAIASPTTAEGNPSVFDFTDSEGNVVGKGVAVLAGQDRLVLQIRLTEGPGNDLLEVCGEATYHYPPHPYPIPQKEILTGLGSFRTNEKGAGRHLAFSDLHWLYRPVAMTVKIWLHPQSGEDVYEGWTEVKVG
jgi:hypothetical protein